MGSFVTFFSSLLNDFSYKDIGIGFFIGLFLGFIVKKSIKFFIFLIFLFLIFLFFVGYKEYIDLNNAIITNQSDRVFSTVKDIFDFTKTLFGVFSFELSSSALLGFLIGFKLG